MKKKSPTDENVINLSDARKRIEAEAKRTGGSPADIFMEMFGSTFGFPAGPYDEAVRRQREQASVDATTKVINEAIEEALKPAFDKVFATAEKAIANTERAIVAAEYNKGAAEHFGSMAGEYDQIIVGLNDAIGAIPYDGSIIEAVIDVLRRDPRMPKLTMAEWELLLGDPIREEQKFLEAVEDVICAASDAGDQVQQIQFACSDCGVDTHDLGEYYMVREEVWEQATAGRFASKLCVGCLEQRIGRKLGKSDFIEAPVNELTGPFAKKSERLLDRLTVEAAP